MAFGGDISKRISEEQANTERIIQDVYKMGLEQRRVAEYTEGLQKGIEIGRSQIYAELVAKGEVKKPEEEITIPKKLLPVLIVVPIFLLVLIRKRR